VSSLGAQSALAWECAFGCPKILTFEPNAVAKKEREREASAVLCLLEKGTGCWKGREGRNLEYKRSNSNGSNLARNMRFHRPPSLCVDLLVWLSPS